MLRDFEQRSLEIELYFSLIEDIIENEAQLLISDVTKVVDRNTKEILKANCFLMLYNVSESCIKNAIEAIYKSINEEGVSYDDLKKCVKLEIISFLKNHVRAQDVSQTVHEIAFGITTVCFKPEKLLSGNLDAKKVKELSRKYDFSSSIVPITNNEGDIISIDTNKLLTVKSKRNELAHGIFSFKECGQAYSFQDLAEIKVHVIEYLRQMLNHIKSYIDDKLYLEVV